MKVNFNRSFKTLSGEDSGEYVNVAVAQALYNYGANKNVNRDDKFRAYRLSQLIVHNAGEVEISTEEATLVKEVCGEAFTAGGYGQIHEIIERG